MDEQQTSRENRELMEAIYDAFSRGDVGLILSKLDDAVEWTDAEGFPYAGTYVGPEAVRGMYERIGADWSRFEAIPSTFVADGEYVVVLGAYTFTDKATGRGAEDVPFAHAWQLRDGKIVRFRQFTDSPPFQRAVE